MEPHSVAITIVTVVSVISVSLVFHSAMRFARDQAPRIVTGDHARIAQGNGDASGMSYTYNQALEDILAYQAQLDSLAKLSLTLVEADQAGQFNGDVCDAISEALQAIREASGRIRTVASERREGGYHLGTTERDLYQLVQEMRSNGNGKTPTNLGES